MSPVTEQILFSGTVQGVGFRWSTERIARNLPITGYVRNLPDRRVEVMVTGDPATISELIRQLQDRFGDGISDVTRVSAATVAEFSGFVIRR
jgi:acylphosphatase